MTLTLDASVSVDKILNVLAAAGHFNYTIKNEEAPKAVINKIEINTATEEDFKALPGIGDVLSKRIIKFRTSIHGFKSVDDISRTYGLSDSTFQLILPYLTISGEQ